MATVHLSAFHYEQSLLLMQYQNTIDDHKAVEKPQIVTIHRIRYLINLMNPFSRKPTLRKVHTVHGAMAFHALTWGNWLHRPHVHYVYIGDMKYMLRDWEILKGVAAFGSMTTAQIRTLYFHDLKTHWSCGSVLKRLTDQGMLARVPVRLPRGNDKGGGSAMGCYQIGKTSWKSLYGKGSPYKPVRDQVKLMHTLLVVETYIAIKHRERTGELRILDYSVESDAWYRFEDGTEVHPDLHLHLDLVYRKEFATIWLEVDRSNEYQKQITEKVSGYVYAYEQSENYHGDKFPEIVFIALDEDRVKSLRRYIKQVPNVDERLITVLTLEQFIDSLI